VSFEGVSISDSPFHSTKFPVQCAAVVIVFYFASGCPAFYHFALGGCMFSPLSCKASRLLSVVTSKEGISAAFFLSA